MFGEETVDGRSQLVAVTDGRGPHTDGGPRLSREDPEKAGGHGVRGRGSGCLDHLLKSRDRCRNGEGGTRCLH